MTYSRRLSIKQSRKALESIWAASRLAAISGPQPFSGISTSNLVCARRINFRHFFDPKAASASIENARSITCEVFEFTSAPHQVYSQDGLIKHHSVQGINFADAGAVHLDRTNFRQSAGGVWL